jgi:hypothetical protein
LTALRFLEGEVGLWVPTVLLAVAICFHLLAGWLIPSLLYLFSVAWRRRGDVRELARSSALGTVIVVAVVAYLNFHGLPVRRFFSSHAGHALRFNGVFAIGMPATYYIEQLNLLLLLGPAILMIVPLVIWRRCEAGDVNRFLMVAAGVMLTFQFIWRAQLGVYNDWNLFAIGALVVTTCLWRLIASAARTRQLRVAASGIALAGWAHTYAWVVSNHLYGR